MKPDYTDKAAHYFENPRREILRLLPPHATRLLDVGCGSGVTAAWLKRIGRCDEAHGIEPFAAAAQIAVSRLDHVSQIDIESGELDYPPAHFDLILCLDVLEHLVDPWKALRRLVPYLQPGGVLIASIPNVRHVSALLPLLCRADWQYCDAGILDRTHLRFFTRKTAFDLIESAGLVAVDSLRNPLERWGKARLLNLVTLGLLRDFLTLQTIIAARRPAS